MSGKDKRIVWLGPDNKSKGGVASVLDTFVLQGYFESGNRVFIPTVEDTSAGGKLIRFFAAFGGLIKLLPGTRLVHIHVSSDASFYRKFIFSLLARVFGVNYLVHLHSSSFPVFYKRTGSFGKKLIRIFYNKAVRVLVLSDDMLNFVTGITPAAEVSIFPNPITINSDFIIENRSNSFLFMGRIFAGKGLEELLNAFGEIEKEFPDWSLLIGGTGDPAYESYLRQEYSTVTNCKWLGWVSGEQKTALLKEVGILVLPSYGEGQSIAILEAMEAGLPVLTTLVGGNTFLLQQDISGKLVQAKDSAALHLAMRDLILQPELRNKLAINARERVEDIFDYNKVKDRLENLYKEL